MGADEAAGPISGRSGGTCLNRAFFFGGPSSFKTERVTAGDTMSGVVGRDRTTVRFDEAFEEVLLRRLLVARTDEGEASTPGIE